MMTAVCNDSFLTLFWLPFPRTFLLNRFVSCAAQLYDSKEGTWTVLDGKMSKGVSFPVAGVIDGKFYVAGGNAGFSKGGITAATQVCTVV